MWEPERGLSGRLSAWQTGGMTEPTALTHQGEQLDPDVPDDAVLVAESLRVYQTKTSLRGSAALSTPIRRKGVVTIPQQVREALHLTEGDQLLVAVEDGRIVLTPAAVVPRDQAWFWTPEWQAKEAEADADRAAGRVTEYATDEEFLGALGTD